MYKIHVTTESQGKPEVWKPIAGYEGIYEVSNAGRVKSCHRFIDMGNWIKEMPEKILVNKFNHKYFFVKLSKDGIRKNVTVHRLVGVTFLPKPKGAECINHIDGDKLNNCLDNLEWCSFSDNNIHCSVNNLVPTQTPNEIALEIIKRRKAGEQIKDISDDLNVNHWTIKSMLYRGKKFKDENYSRFKFNG